jgi:capsular polysaccharide transport system permease protein
MAPSSEGSLKAGLATQWRVIHALMVRDMMMRYGRDNLGFVWTVVEPMILTAGVMFIWSIIRQGGEEHGIRVAEFVMTGYMPLTLWRHMSARTAGLFRRASGLLYHRRISLFDIVFATLFLEFIATSAALSFVLVFATVCGFVDPIKDLRPTLCGWLLMGWLAGGVGMVTAVLTEVSDVVEHFIQPLQYLLLPISGVFYMVDWLPANFREAALLNPITHCYEAFRAGFFGDEMTLYYDYSYVAAWSLGFTFVGVALIHIARSRVKLQ